MPDTGLLAGVVGRIKKWLRHANFGDLLSAGSHSRDFDQVRADYIYRRVRLLAFALAVAAPLWIPIDVLLLDPGLLAVLVPLRLAFAGAFLGLGLWTSGRHEARSMRLRMALLILVPALFYVGSRVAMGGGLPADGVMVGYSFLPFLFAALLGIFPLTLREGATYAGILFVAMVGTNLAYGTPFTIPHIRDAWLLLLLFVVAFWGQLSQLDMLLRLHREATRDWLTGLVNRRVIIRWLDQEVATAQAEGRPMSVLLFDLDMFKRVNDTYGHLTGDRVLARFAEALTATLPKRALAGRYGGEEFIAVLPDTDAPAAQAVAEEVRRQWRETPVEGAEGELLYLTTSIGVSAVRSGEDNDALVARVDDSLYHAKESGRDLVVVAGAEAEPTPGA